MPTLLNTLPPNLQTAIQSSIQDAEIPKQGNQLLRYVASCELRGEELNEEFLSEAANAIDDWVRLQVSLQKVAAEVLNVLEKIDPYSGESGFPVWRTTGWGQELMMPWSEGLKNSVLCAFEYICSNA